MLMHVTRYRAIISLTITSLLVIAVIQENFSPVFVASQEGHTQVVELLIGAGANVHLATSEVLLVMV